MTPNLTGFCGNSSEGLACRFCTGIGTVRNACLLHCPDTGLSFIADAILCRPSAVRVLFFCMSYKLPTAYGKGFSPMGLP